MDLLALAIQVAAVGLLVYGGVHCFWHQLERYLPPIHERRRRRYRGERNLRLIVELDGARAAEAEEVRAEPVVEDRKAA